MAAALAALSMDVGAEAIQAAVDGFGGFAPPGRMGAQLERDRFLRRLQGDQRRSGGKGAGRL